MRVAMYYNNQDVRLEEMPVPKIGPGELLVKVIASGICGSDVMEWYRLKKAPLVLGHEIAGEIIEIGDGVQKYRVGDHVFVSHHVPCKACHYCLSGNHTVCDTLRSTNFDPGGFAEYISFPKYFLHKCNGMEYDEAAFIEPTGVALYATKLAKVCPEDYLAVVGPGPIGLFAVQTAKAYGARKVVLVGTRASRLKTGQQLGADVTVNVRTENLMEKVTQATGGHMVDVVLEAAGKPEAWDDIAPILAPRARIAMTGLFAGKKCQVNFDPLVINNVTILGTLGGPSCWDEAINLHECGKITAKPLITHRLALEDFGKGVEIMRNRIDNAVKVVLVP